MNAWLSPLSIAQKKSLATVVPFFSELVPSAVSDFFKERKHSESRLRNRVLVVFSTNHLHPVCQSSSPLRNLQDSWPLLHFPAPQWKISGLEKIKLLANESVAAASVVIPHGGHQSRQLSNRRRRLL